MTLSKVEQVTPGPTPVFRMTHVGGSLDTERGPRSQTVNSFGDDDYVKTSIIYLRPLIIKELEITFVKKTTDQDNRQTDG